MGTYLTRKMSRSNATKEMRRTPLSSIDNMHITEFTQNSSRATIPWETVALNHNYCTSLLTSNTRCDRLNFRITVVCKGKTIICKINAIKSNFYTTNVVHHPGA